MYQVHGLGESELLQFQDFTDYSIQHNPNQNYCSLSFVDIDKFIIKFLWNAGNLAC